jgi:hypothetical protein
VIFKNRRSKIILVKVISGGEGNFTKLGGKCSLKGLHFFYGLFQPLLVYFLKPSRYIGSSGKAGGKIDKRILFAGKVKRKIKQIPSAQRA